MKPILLEFNSPHFLQTAYQHGVSCGDAVFAAQGAALKVLKGGGKVFLPLFDLEKDFDTIERQCYCNDATIKASVAEHGGLSTVGTQVQRQQ